MSVLKLGVRFFIHKILIEGMMNKIIDFVIDYDDECNQKVLKTEHSWSPNL